MKKYQSVIYFDKNNELHRLDGPAYIDINGHKEWHQNGKYHRLDGPARIFKHGFKVWWVNGKHCNSGDEPPEIYLKELERLGIPFVRGSDDSEDYPE